MASNTDGSGMEMRRRQSQAQESLDVLTRMATILRSRSILVEDHQIAVDDPRLDPSNPQFDHFLWAQAAFQSLNCEGVVLQRQGVVFSNLSVSGSAAALQFQETVLSTFTVPFRKLAKLVPGRKPTVQRHILHSFDGLLQSGELLLVLGRPGSGCTTFLKTICGHLGGLRLEGDSNIHYEGISFEQMTKQFRGEVAYNQEVDEHFPHLTVGETLAFAASARTPSQRPGGLTRAAYVDTVVKVVMAMFGLSHTVNTKVGDNFVHGVSGGERKRVSIAEMFLSRVRIGAWDNSTRGLDAASALQFIQSLRLSANRGKACHAVAAYQASESIYDLFDRVVVLYEGYEIFYGPRERAVEYFEKMGWHRDPQQVSPDFLTAVTNPGERRARSGMEEKVPRTPTEFFRHWKQSEDHRRLMVEIEQYRKQYPLHGKTLEDFQASHTKQQAKHSRPLSPYILSVPMQTRLCLTRAYQRMRNDLPTTLSTVFNQVALSLIIGSIFYNSPNTSSAFFQKGSVLFFAVLMNALITITEIMQQYGQRPIVDKQARYAFVHPATEALASVLSDLPIKLARCTAFCIIVYFMTNLRREPGAFFVFYLFIITTIITMSGLFRTLAAVTKVVGQAMGFAGIIIICLIVYTGFTLPQTYMRPWLSWIRWINPAYYAFEALVSNEFHGRQFQCGSFIPPYGTGNSTVCSAVGAIPGQQFVSGDTFIRQNYNYTWDHTWRNYGILFGLLIFFHLTYFAATEYIRDGRSKAETLVFRPGRAPRYLQQDDVEGQARTVSSEMTVGDRMLHLPKQEDVLMWRGVNYDIPVKEGTRRLLDGVNGWVKPGTLTALMGVSGAGKTTLLDVLAQRASLGVVTGDILVNGQPLTSSFPRRVGYVQQQDLHLETTTVREALRFSAMLRQSRSTPKGEKYQYVEEVIQILGMEDFSEAVVGQLGEGLNVEQRKLLSIGVELAAKPDLLIFLDEPTSGLDSQSSWTICTLLRKLADQGQAILATIHQPGALLFQTFDRLLFLAEGGKTVYFGEIGPHSRIVLDYFTRCGARPCRPGENPAEYILEMVSGEQAMDVDWVGQWNDSPELRRVVAELDQLSTCAQSSAHRASANGQGGTFALPLHSQLYHVAVRVFQQYYRQPNYIFTKFILGIVSGLFIGFSFFKANHSEQGFQNALFSVFLLCSIFSALVNQIMPKFVVQRALYEVRERPSRVYSWKVFILAQVLVEMPWQVLLGVCAWAASYFPVFSTTGSSETRGLVLLFIVQFYIYAASMAQMLISAIESATVAAQLAILMFGLSLIFNGIMQPPDALPGFWIFMYRVSPFTYYVSGIGSAALHGREVRCSDAELSVVDPPAGQTCGEYFARYLEAAAGRLSNPDDTSSCQYCALTSADQFLAQRRIFYDERWRNYGIFWCYFVFNTVATVLLYYLFRVRVWRPRKR
ncbi:ABC transporter CDR4 [Pleurostoma richardsiae]|uniref:ABC transporter CDR4 n=1 Tax=Pleurostoma richardsiae TaxID=41990 RepID=A0AA38RPX0_9PEZI|nr:ABC transporter CDR4 [Pleurostoma richardsiae]